MEAETKHGKKSRGNSGGSQSQVAAQQNPAPPLNQAWTSPVSTLALPLRDKLHVSHSCHSGFNTHIAQPVRRMQTILNNLHFAFRALEFTHL